MHSLKGMSVPNVQSGGKRNRCFCSLPWAAMSALVRRCVALFLLSYFYCLGGVAFASNASELIAERLWFEDQSGQLTWEQVRTQQFIPFANVLARGYGRSPVWVKLRIDPGQDRTRSGEMVYLRARPAYLDEIQVYDALQNPEKRPTLGDRHAYPQGAEGSTSFLMTLPRGDEPRDIWIRLQTTSTRLAYFEVLDSLSLQKSQTQINHLSMLYLCLIGTFIVWGLVQMLIHPDRLLFAFLVYELITFIFGACVLGFTQFYFSDSLLPSQLDLATSISGIVAPCATLVFSYFLLKELNSSAWAGKAILWVISIFPLLLMAVFLGYTVEALQTNMLLVLVVPVAIFALATLTARRASSADQGVSRLPTWVVLTYLGISSIFTLLTAAPALGLISGEQSSLYVVLFYSVGAGTLMFLMLQYRAWREIRLQISLKAVAEEATVRAKQERAQREDREKLLAMLGHEIKTPLATIRMMLANRDIPPLISQQIDSNVFDITNVVDRAIQAGKVESNSIAISVQLLDLLQLIDSVLNGLADSDRVEFQVQGTGSSKIQTDGPLLKMILRNLLDNAVKYGASKESVTLTAIAPDPSTGWQILVTNHVGSAGLPDASRVFQKYYRSPKASNYSGSGLGLYLAHGLSKLIGGDLRYEPEDRLVRFRLVLPHSNSDFQS